MSQLAVPTSISASTCGSRRCCRICLARLPAAAAAHQTRCKYHFTVCSQAQSLYLALHVTFLAPTQPAVAGGRGVMGWVWSDLVWSLPGILRERERVRDGNKGIADGPCPPALSRPAAQLAGTTAAAAASPPQVPCGPAAAMAPPQPQWQAGAVEHPSMHPTHAPRNPTQVNHLAGRRPSYT
jgi:hypothetical protein